MSVFPVNRIGMVARLSAGKSAADSLAPVKNLSLPIIQLGGIYDALLFGEKSASLRQDLALALKECGAECLAVWLTFPGQEWSVEKGPDTVGLVPEKLRTQRMLRSCMIADLALELGVKTLAVHIGFLPQPDSESYAQFADEMRYFLAFLAARDQELLLETGQESADELLEFISALSADNIGINFDPANLVIYNTDQPLAALDKLMPLVRCVHIKDAVAPEKPGTTGKEVRFGLGEVNADAFLGALKEKNYTGALIIEREISGAEQIEDINLTIAAIKDF